MSRSNMSDKSLSSNNRSCNGKIFRKETVIPTGAFPSRREGNAEWRDLLFLRELHSFLVFATLTLIIMAVATALPFQARAQKSIAPSVTADLPPGPMQSKATTTCLECHEARIILQQRLSKAAWTKEVDKMTKWGAVVDPSDREALIDYLSSNFSPDKPAYEPQRTSGRSSK
jgi:hypothetical protein